MGAYILPITGDQLASGIYGEIHAHDLSTPQSIANGATYIKLNSFTDNGFSSYVTPDQANNQLIITEKGRYRVEGSFSFSAGTPNLEWFCGAFLDDVEQDNEHWTRKVSVAGDVGNANMTGIIEVNTVPAILDVRIRHDDTVAANITMSYLNLNCNYLGKL